jgi:hypothetical protein
MPFHPVDPQCEMRRSNGSKSFRAAAAMADTSSTEDIFARALEFGSPTERQQFLEQACAGNAGLRGEIETLLRAHDEAGEFLDESRRNPAPASTRRVSEPLPRDGGEALLPPAIAGFRIERRIGRGGIGVVYEAWDEKLHRKVALKTLHAAPDADSRRRILDEARKIAALRDPAIVTVHAVLDDHEPPAIVMELVEGFPIDQFAAGLTFEQRARILHEVARALAAAHQRGIIHRDLKQPILNVSQCMQGGSGVMCVHMIYGRNKIRATNVRSARVKHVLLVHWRATKFPRT